MIFLLVKLSNVTEDFVLLSCEVLPSGRNVNYTPSKSDYNRHSIEAPYNHHSDQARYEHPSVIKVLQWLVSEGTQTLSF